MRMRSSRLGQRNGKQQVIHWVGRQVPTIPHRPYPSRRDLRLTFRSPLRVRRPSARTVPDSQCTHLRTSRLSLDRNRLHVPRHSQATINNSSNIFDPTRKVPRARTAMGLSVHQCDRRREVMLHHSRLWDKRALSPSRISKTQHLQDLLLHLGSR